ncbi:hypothetical protein COB28_04575 [Candidatus Dependentiae bacterium]|nr:MAG: hypothetical protein COB28_04575 [Candidatus Dependentiae bacterium]
MQHYKVMISVWRLFIAAVCFNQLAYSIIVGDDTSVSRQANVFFPSADTDNNMQGFASFENGITLEDASTTCTFNSLLRLSGSVNWSHGEFHLLRDVKLSDPCYIMSMGHIFGNNHTLELAPSTTALDLQLEETYTLDSVSIKLSNNLTLSLHLSFNNESAIFGNGYAIDFAQTGSISVGAGGSLLLKNLTLKNLSSSRLACLDTNATVTLQNVNIILDDHYSFDLGHFDIVGKVFVDGRYTFSYKSGSISRIQNHGVLSLGEKTTFRYEPSTAEQNGLSFIDSTGCFFLNGGVLSSSTTGLQLTKGNLLIDGKVGIQSDAISSAEGIIFGNGIDASSDLKVVIMPEGNIELQSGYLVNKNLS